MLPDVFLGCIDYISGIFIFEPCIFTSLYLRFQVNQWLTWLETAEEEESEEEAD